VQARTVEGDVETAMFECGMIDPRNYGDIKKIRFSRASRTDKRVHALLNYFACKVHIDKEKGLDHYKQTLNSICPKDIHVFSLIEVNKHFDAKASTNFREYDYYMPSFML
jgi:tRNA pseudouridine38-40 synthase